MPHRPRPSRRSQRTAARGYGGAWQQLAKATIAAQPWCSWCGSTEDLVADHVTSQVDGGEPLGPTQTLCRDCNSRKQ